MVDGAIPDTHLDISAPEVDEKSWFALRNRLTDVLIEALGIPSERWHVNVKLNSYDPHTFAVAGNAADELPVADEPAAPKRKRRVRRTALLLGVIVGAAAGYSWLSERLGSETLPSTRRRPEGTRSGSGARDRRRVRRGHGYAKSGRRGGGR